jgi:hypothetical protein
MSDTLGILEMIRQAAIVRLTGATPDVVDLESRWVISDFLARSRLWQRTVQVPLSPGVVSYAIPGVQTYESMVLMLEASYKSRPLLLSDFPIVTAEDSTPSSVRLGNDRTLEVYPAPDASITDNLSVKLAATILPANENPIPAVIRPYHQAVLDGVLARMYMIPDKPYTNTRLAPVHQVAYEREISNVRRIVGGGRGRNALFVQFAPFA